MTDSIRSYEFLLLRRNQNSNGEISNNDDQTDARVSQTGDNGYRNPAYEDEDEEFPEFVITPKNENDLNELYETDSDEVELRDEEEEEYSWIAENIPILTPQRNPDSQDSPDEVIEGDEVFSIGADDKILSDELQGQSVQNDKPDLTLSDDTGKPSHLPIQDNFAATSLPSPKSPKDVLDEGKPPKNVETRNWIADHIPLPPGSLDLHDIQNSTGIEVKDVKLLDSQPFISKKTTIQKTNLTLPPQPNTAFGKIEFVGYGFRTPSYARVDKKTDAEKVVYMMHEIWKMRLPTVLLSVYGNVIIGKSLLNAAKRLGAWITSPACSRETLPPDDQVMKIIEDFDDAPNVGVEVWRRVHSRGDLVNVKATGSFPAIYRRPTDSFSEYMHLDPRHSQFLLLDGATTPADNYTDRMEMEETIRKSLSIPQVVILGDHTHLLDVMDAALEKNNHILLFKGRSKAAEALEKLKCLQKARNNKFVRRTTNPGKLISTHRIREVMMQLLGARSIERKVEIMKRCLQKYRFITIVPGSLSEQSGSLWDVILKLLIKAKRGSPEAQTWSHPLSFVASNSDDSDEEDIMYQELIPWKLGDTKYILLDAILSDDVECVRMMLNEGGSIKCFSSMELIYLYNKIPESSILQKLLWERNDQESITTLYDVGQVVKDILGDKFHSRHLEASYKNMNVKDMLALIKSRYTTRSAKEIEDVSTVLKNLDGLDLFMWSILLNRQELAKLFWRRGKAHLAWALLAKHLLSALEINSRDAETSARLAKSAQEFQNLAMGILHEMHTANPKRTQGILVQRTDELEGTSVAIIATELANRQFISHIACQSLYQKIFHGTLREQNSFLKILICIFLPMLIPCLLKFREETQYVSKRRKKKKQDKVESGVEYKMSTRERLWKQIVNIVRFYKTPIVVFTVHSISFLCFLTLYGYVILFQMKMNELFAAEMILHIWIATLICEEIRQFVMDSQETAVKGMSLYYWSCVWNRVDILHTVLYVTAIILRFIPNEQTYEAGRILFCVNFVLLTMHIMNVYFLHKQLGPKLAMIRKMVWDLIYFLLILFIFVCGFGVAVEAILLKNVELNWKFFFIDLFKRPYFHIYGELFLDEVDGSICSTDPSLPECSTMARHYVALYLVGIYMIFSNVLLLNLLIAMFSTTYQNIQNETDEYWYFHQISTVREYSFKPPLPPPLVILCHIYYICRYVCQKTCHCNNKDRFAALAKPFSPTEKMKLIAWEKRRVQHFLCKQQKEQDETIEARMDSMSLQMAELSDLVKNLNKRVEKINRGNNT